MERRCYIHIGTHKTGTTSLQVMLHEHADRFADAGVFIPRSGQLAEVRSAIAHHNIAWQLNGVPRFDARHGTLSDLASELRENPARTALISSEDFSLTYDKPGSLEALRDAIRSAGFVPYVIAYVREQGSMLTSQFAEMTKARHDATFEDFLAEVLLNGSFRFGYNTQLFEYDTLLARYAFCFGSKNVAAFAYAEGLTADALVRNFADIVGLPTPSVSAANLRVNESLTFGAMLGELHRTFAYRQKDLPDHWTEMPELEELARSDVLDSPFRPLDAADSQRIRARFALSNLVLRAHYGVRLPEKKAHDATETGARQRAFLAHAMRTWKRKDPLR